MGRPTNTTTRIAADGEVAGIHFSDMAPQFNVAYVQSEGGGVDLSAELGRLHASLGQKTLELEALRQRVADLELGQTAVGRTDVEVQPIEVVSREAESTTAASNGSGLKSPTPQETAPALKTAGTEQLTAQRNGEIDLSATPGLSSVDQRYERVILYMLQQPGLAVLGDDAGGKVKRDVGIDNIITWNNTRTRLVELGILQAKKSHPQARRSNEMSIDPEALLRHAGKSFVTAQAISLLQERSAEFEAAAHERAPETSIAETQQPAANGANGAASKHKLSPRVRRAQEREPDPQAGYRQEVPLKTFLGHRRERTGVKERHK